MEREWLLMWLLSPLLSAGSTAAEAFNLYWYLLDELASSTDER